MGVNCRLCNSTDNHPEYKTGEYSILKCVQCGFVFSSPLPPVDTIYNMYKNRYFNSIKTIGYPDYTENKKIRSETFSYYYSIIKPFLSSKHAALDIGCADGSFLDVLKAEGFSLNEGVELNEEMYEETRKRYSLYKEPIENVNIPHQYDLITLFDVLEHIPDLRAAASKISNLLNKNGLVVILTPDYGSLQRKLKGKNWFQFKPMEHINYFTRERLTGFLESAGLEVIHYSKGVSLADKDFLSDRLKRYNYRFLGFLFSLFGKFFFMNKKFMKIGNSSIFIIAKHV